MRLLGTLLVLSAAVLAQTPDLKTASGYPKMVQKQVTGWLERVADKMPEEEYAFKPDPAVRSFGQILGHVADANANDLVKAFGQERNKLGVLWFNASHNLEHYGNLVVYMRTKGIVPPSSEPKPK